MPFGYDTSVTAFVIITLALGGGAALMTGRAVALGWQPIWKVVVYTCLIAAAVRFLHYGLANGTPPATLATSAAPKLIWCYLIDLAVLTIISTLSYRIARASQMVAQYPWLYKRTGPLSWKEKQS